MVSQPKWFRENFALSHACAGIVVYGLAIMIANLDKSTNEILALTARQAVTTFLFTGLLVPRVQRLALGVNCLAVVFYGIFVPATVVAVASVTAHWYWTNETRNILAPFVVSVVLNCCLVCARRAGHDTFLTQMRWYAQLVGLAK